MKSIPRGPHRPGHGRRLVKLAGVRPAWPAMRSSASPYASTYSSPPPSSTLHGRDQPMTPWRSPTMEDAAELWASAADVTELERRWELHESEREKVAAAVERWSGRKASPEQVFHPSVGDMEPSLCRVSMPPSPAQPRFAPEAENDAEALLADLTSPSQLRRRGAKSALRWMAEEEVSFDTYDETVAAAAEWAAANQVAVTLDMQDVLERLGLGRHSAGLARMGIATLSDVGKRTPSGLITVAGLQPRECQSLLMELLSGCGARVARTELAPGSSAWERTSQPMWDSPPRIGPDEPIARAGTSIVKAAATKGKAAALKARAREEGLTEQWLKERAGLKKKISDLEKQHEALRKALDQQIRDVPEHGLPSPMAEVAAPTKQADRAGPGGNGSAKEVAVEQRKERLRSNIINILTEDIAGLEAKLDEWEKKESGWKEESRRLRLAAGKGAGGRRGAVDEAARLKGIQDSLTEAGWKRKQAKWKQDEAALRKTIEELRDAERPVTQLDLSSAETNSRAIVVASGSDAEAASPSPRTALRSLLMNVPMMQHLNEDELSGVIESVDVEEFNPHVAIVTEGEPGEAMYFLAGGGAEASVKVSQLNPLWRHLAMFFMCA